VAGYTSIYALLKAFLATVGHTNVGREVPSNLAFDLPFHVVERFGGADRANWLDIARVDIDTYAAAADTAEDFAEQIRAAMRTRLVRYMFDGSTVSKVETMSAPKLIPYDATNVFRASASYQLTISRYVGVS
jgi:hypothetical protein